MTRNIDSNSIADPQQKLVYQFSEKMAKILITGGAGFIGSNLSRANFKGHDVTVLDNLSYQIHGNYQKNLNFI